jgi:hypothetical protein
MKRLNKTICFVFFTINNFFLSLVPIVILIRCYLIIIPRDFAASLFSPSLGTDEQSGEC